MHAAYRIDQHRIDSNRNDCGRMGTMRLQLALNVSDLDQAVDFYSRMFGVRPAKTRPGYANFAIAEPPLKLVLFAGAGEPGSLNHLGVETETADQVVAAEARLSATGLPTTGVDDTRCCYAAKTETWVHGPDGARWEWYVKTGDTEQFANLVAGSTGTASDVGSAATGNATTGAATATAATTAGTPSEAGSCATGGSCCP
jgi:catechol 2,3-dioxygenase-like lactoylglutathione lyase family enzyme